MIPRTSLAGLVLGVALGACSRGDTSASIRTDANGWVVAFAAPTDTLYLDTASIARVGQGVYRAWFRSTRTPQQVQEQTDCVRRRTRQVALSTVDDRSVVRHEETPWEEVPATGRGAAYVRTLCEIAPRR
ncbi:MAG TPA: hypothetical protein VGX50_12545 [Longimicrobium sp.]|nr:hypothetical protein [Longimicrobium sp.]